MVLAFSGFVMFLLVFFLVFVFHSFGWNSDWFSLEGVRSWASSFECGFLGQRLVENSFSYTYFILLVFFVVFDLEISLLLNMPLQGLLFKNLVYYLFFLFLLSVGFSFEVSKGYVEWSY
uniref:NADH-ubiquinone oxidoreductase chain 3 n=1 Tax=Cercaria capricornia TaxID=1542953 RepID=A0A2I6K2B8_9TREM|nr:NADH dehydrogenase subunit 3 [Cercaria capricornia]